MHSLHHYHRPPLHDSSLLAPPSPCGTNAVNNHTKLGCLVICSHVENPGRSVWHQLNRIKWKTFSVFSCIFAFLHVSCVAPPYVKDPPSVHPPPSSFFSYLSFCSFALCSFSLSPPLPSLCSLWYADTQEFLGLKMIDQTCQAWLLLLKMAALVSVFACDWCTF